MDPQPDQQAPAASPTPPDEAPAGQPGQGGSWATPAEPAGPAPGLHFGGYGGRLVAYIVDIFLVSIVSVAIALVLVLVGAVLLAGGFDALAGATFVFLVVAMLVVSFGYFPWFWWRSGQTPGMRLFGLRVVRDRDGGPVSGGQAVLRLIGYYVSGAVFYLGYIWIFIDGRRRGWHDLIAGTVVVQEDR
ncbi:MAG TPA: RDD family protein [Candidatus Limnocylindrales bacterium]|nr:RDD family protein [Candidatus Limnocylindrales bacterium]